MLSKILIANRGEIACRIIHTAKQLGIKTVAVFSEADCNALHVKIADEAYLIGPAASKESYLNIERIISVAIKAQVQAIHPGYGFLSENEHFAKACEQNEIIFIGPSSTVISLMGNKNIAKQIMQQHAVPILPGYYDETNSLEHLLAAAKEIGFPIVLKAVAGGGGKGLRLVHHENEFEQAYFAVRREAKAFFNDEKLLLEKYLSHARHVEVQILADHFGYVAPLFTRDCSIQRRHQKIIEEAPAPNLSLELQEKMMAAAVQAARAIEYTNAGTIEFLVEQENFYFMEMNTRLQVEHPVTEMITGLDLVEWQLRIAAKQPLVENSFQCRGHAIEVRLNAEDPEKDFLPSAGKLHYFNIPNDFDYIRIDSGYQMGDQINIYYDSLLAKLIVWGEDRLLAIHRLQQLLNKTALFGIKTNLSLLKTILQNTNFQKANINTHFLQNETLNLIKPISNNKIGLGGLFLMLINQRNSREIFHNDAHSPWHQHDGWQLFSPSMVTFYFLKEQQTIRVTLKKQNGIYSINVNNEDMSCRVTQFSLVQENIYEIELIMDAQHYDAKVFYTDSKLEVILNDVYYLLEISDDNNIHHELGHEQQLLAPMPGTLVALLVNSGQKVTKGDKLLVIEAMKMEHTLYAPRDGVIKECYYQIGDLVKEGSELIEFET